MHYIEAPNFIPPDAPRPYVFLAGGITGCPDWQKELVDMLREFPYGTLMNPRRADFPMGDPDAGRVQIKWEFDRLWEDTDIFTMWFSNGSIGPICLLELGAHLSRHKTLVDGGHPPPYAAMVVGGDEDYTRRFDVEQQSEHFIGFPVTFHTSLETHSDLIQDAVRRYNSTLEETEAYGLEDEDPEQNETSGDEHEADDQPEEDI